MTGYAMYGDKIGGIKIEGFWTKKPTVVVTVGCFSMQLHKVLAILPPFVMRLGHAAPTSRVSGAGVGSGSGTCVSLRAGAVKGGDGLRGEWEVC